MYIEQKLLQSVNASLQKGKVTVILGPRRCGKTTLIRHVLQNYDDPLFVSGEDIDVRHFLSSQSINQLKQFVGNHSLLVIDEAQKIENIGLNLKLLTDHCPELMIMATGSSAFELAKQTGEPLTGRKKTFHLFPLSQMELNALENPAEVRANLPERLIYGAYPEVVLMKEREDKKDYLAELVSDYLYKDILELDGVRKSQKIVKLLQLLAFQVGKEVSISELGTQIGLNKETVSHYLDLLEKCFVLVGITGFSRNLRKEINKKCRYYFYDTGVRNAIINQYNAIDLRSDKGELWENYLVMERIKKQQYCRIHVKDYFWRTYDQQEIDWIEEGDELNAYEFKWKPTTGKSPLAFANAYPHAKYNVIHRDNYLEFIC